MTGRTQDGQGKNPYHQTLLCFPHAGGSAHVLGAFAASFGPRVRVVAVELPGRGRRVREAPLSSIRDLVVCLREEHRELLRQPFAFYGQSMGAVIAFELARTLRREHRPMPVAIFVASRRAPDAPSPIPDLHLEPDELLLSRLHSEGTVPRDVFARRTWREYFLRILRADLTAAETYEYVPEEPLPTPIAAFHGAHDGWVARNEMMGWERHTAARFSLSEVPGGHLLAEDAARALVCAAIERELRAQEVPSAPQEEATSEPDNRCDGSSPTRAASVVQEIP